MVAKIVWSKISALLKAYLQMKFEFDRRCLQNNRKASFNVQQLHAWRLKMHLRVANKIDEEFRCDSCTVRRFPLLTLLLPIKSTCSTHASNQKGEWISETSSLKVPIFRNPGKKFSFLALGEKIEYLELCNESKEQKDWIDEDILKTEKEGIEHKTNIQNILHCLYHWCCNVLLVYWFTPGGPAPPGFCLSFLEATATQAGRTPWPAWPAQGHVGHIHRLRRWHHKLVLQVAQVALCFFLMEKYLSSWFMMPNF